MSAVSNPINDDELIAALNELLEAERAGARVALETLSQAAEDALAPLIMDIQRDEVRWCKMLMSVIRSVGATPSSATGNFYQKAIIIEDLKDRLLFVNRGQEWVVRRLQSLISRVDDAFIRQQLLEMMDAHIKNIDLVKDSI